MAKDILTAKVAIVRFGAIEIEGLLFQDGRYGVAVPQIAVLFPYFKTDKNNASILFKRLMGKDFKTDKVKAEFNKNITTAVDLIGFERVLRKLDKADDPVAEAMSDALIGLSLNQIFSDSFGVVFEKAERQSYLASCISETTVAKEIAKKKLGAKS